MSTKGLIKLNIGMNGTGQTSSEMQVLSYKINNRIGKSKSTCTWMTFSNIFEKVLRL